MSSLSATSLRPFWERHPEWFRTIQVEPGADVQAAFAKHPEVLLWISEGMGEYRCATVAEFRDWLSGNWVRGAIAAQPQGTPTTG